MYADYNYYITTYKGTEIPDAETYSSLAIEADALIDAMTMHRIDITKGYMPRVKDCECGVIETLHAQKQDNTTKASESVGNHSVTYAVQRKTTASYDEEKGSKIRLYLSGTELLYRGLC